MLSHRHVESNLVVTIVGIEIFRPANDVREALYNLVTADGIILEPWLGDDAHPNYYKTGTHTKASMESFIGRTFELVNNSVIWGEYWPEKMIEIINKPQQASLFDTPGVRSDDETSICTTEH